MRGAYYKFSCVFAEQRLKVLTAITSVITLVYDMTINLCFRQKDSIREKQSDCLKHPLIFCLFFLKSAVPKTSLSETQIWVWWTFRGPNLKQRMLTRKSNGCFLLSHWCFLISGSKSSFWCQESTLFSSRLPALQTDTDKQWYLWTYKSRSGLAGSHKQKRPDETLKKQIAPKKPNAR